VLTLEWAKELNFPPDAISTIQTSLQLMSNTNYHTTVAHKNAILMQLNPHLNRPFSDVDFKNAAPLLLGENFGTVAKEQLDAATALKKTTFTDRGGYRKATPKGINIVGVDTSSVANTTTRVLAGNKATRNDY